MEIYDVIVVGAGISGLTAAYNLLKTNDSLNLCIFEANDRIGGRLCGETVMTASGMQKFDLGGQWVGSCQKDIYTLLEELSIETYPQFTDGKKLILLNDKRKILSYNSEIPDINIFAQLDIYWFLHKVNTLSDQLSGVDAYSRGLLEFDKITLQTYLEQTLWTADGKKMIDASVRCIFGAEADSMSFLYFLNYVNCAGGTEPLLNASQKFGGQELRVKGGAWRICDVLLSKLNNVTLHLSSPINSITQLSDCIEIISEGQKYLCKYAIVTVPQNQITNIGFEPPLPNNKKYLLKRQKIGSLTKIIITYEKAFWRERGLSGEVVCNSWLLPICISFDATLDDNVAAALVCFVGGKQQDAFKLLSVEERKRTILGGLLWFFGPDILHPLDYKEKNWEGEKYVGGCPCSATQPGILADNALYPHVFAQPHGRVYFAGTEMATRWCGFINGAVETGRFAANQVLRSMDPNAPLFEDEVSQETKSNKKVKSSLTFKLLIVCSLLAVPPVVLIAGRYIL